MGDKAVELIRYLGSLISVLVAMLVGWHKYLNRGDLRAENKSLKEENKGLREIIRNFKR